MEYVLFKGTKVVGISSKTPYTGTPALNELHDKDGAKIDYDSAKSSRELASFAQATSAAATLHEITGFTYIPFDNGQFTSHRFGVMQLPKIGDDVSYGFNGDYYPCGKIIRITPSLRIIAQDERGNESTFFRSKQSSGWMKKGGTWSLVKGIYNELNPSF